MGFLLEGEFFDTQRCKVLFPFNNTMPTENRDRHVFDPVIVVQDLAFILHKEIKGYLPQRGRASSIA